MLYAFEFTPVDPKSSAPFSDAASLVNRQREFTIVALP